MSTSMSIEEIIARVVKATVAEIMRYEKKEPEMGKPTPPDLSCHIDSTVGEHLQTWHPVGEPEELGVYVELNSYAAILTPDQLRMVADVLEAYNATVRAYNKHRDGFPS